ncbi:hypothetical protein [Acinetobacter junii]|uniref:hypothetical protein n=1 Tax=Acinetobacter junii TaxID=40215 RepID=UPI00125027A8|nr:hypothetical protein [Acinetobacter junii]
MNAIQFIQDNGVEKARGVIEGAPERATHLLNGEYVRVSDPRWILDSYVSIDDLKRLVESVDLVEYFGNDLVGAKQLLEFSKDCKTIELSGSVITVERLKQAIADYESIYSDNNMGDDSHIENHVSPLCKVGVK